jgi:hypothetical protein
MEYNFADDRFHEAPDSHLNVVLILLIPAIPVLLILLTTLMSG